VGIVEEVDRVQALAIPHHISPFAKRADVLVERVDPGQGVVAVNAMALAPGVFGSCVAIIVERGSDESQCLLFGQIRSMGSIPWICGSETRVEEPLGGLWVLCIQHPVTLIISFCAVDLVESGKAAPKDVLEVDRLGIFHEGKLVIT
jgi:hypothetical protein